MKILSKFVVIGLVAVLAMLGTARADGYDMKGWWPTEWGKDDTAGAINRITPDSILKSIKLVKKGHAAVLGKVYQSDMPAFGVRAWKMVIPGLPTGGPFPGGLVYNDEFLATEIGQIGTQFDGPGHIGVHTGPGQDMYYNGRNLQEVGSSYGLGPLGVDQVAAKAFVCRGVLLNAAAYRGMPMLPIPKGGDRNDPGNVNDDDIKGIVKKQGLAEIGEGDCVFLYTGWGDIWDPVKWDSFSADEKQKRIAKFNAGEPGWGYSGCMYLASRKIAMTGGDNWANDAVPSETPNRPFECHVELQTARGIWNIENLQFVQLLAENQYEFLFVWSPLRMKGATGSPGNPVAIW